VQARQIQRLLNRVGSEAQRWQEREYRSEQTEPCDAQIM
jgi:hypothetical protein